MSGDPPASGQQEGGGGVAEVRSARGQDTAAHTATATRATCVRLCIGNKRSLNPFKGYGNQEEPVIS